MEIGRTRWVHSVRFEGLTTTNIVAACPHSLISGDEPDTNNDDPEHDGEQILAALGEHAGEYPGVNPEPRSMLSRQTFTGQGSRLRTGLKRGKSELA
jgi:hypothetical protein